VIQLGGDEARQIVILSGKGGTGKTSVCAAFAHLASLDARSRAVLVDADVDASNLELVLAPRHVEEHDFSGGQQALIDPALCGGCGTCATVCRFDAVVERDGIYAVDPTACEGCAACTTQCPYGAIRMEPQMAGRWFRSDSRYGPLFHARLIPAAENSGKLVALVRQQASQLAQREGCRLVLVDGPPGIGCPVIAACSGVDLAVIVAEPSLAAIHDMARIVATLRHFRIPALVCINKADIYPEGCEAIEAACYNAGLPVAARIPYDTAVIEAMVQGQPITLHQPDGPVSRAIGKAWGQVLTTLNGREGNPG
jgi:MinD superfamily P-loop ATPase